MPAEFDSGVFYHDGAWHGDGNVVQERITSPDEAVELASMAWSAEKEPIYVKRTDEDGKERYEVVESHCANKRSDTNAVLGIVGAERHNVQNIELVQFVMPWVEAGLVDISALISLRGGKRVALTCEILDSSVDIVPGDTVKSYVNLAHGHDSSLAIRLGFSDVRVVCSNTMRSLLETADLLKHRHTRNCMVNLEAARGLFDLKRANMRVQADIFQALAKRTVNDAQALAYFREVFHEGAGTDPAIKVRNTDRLIELFEAGRGAQFSRGTLWGAFNAVTEFCTHERGHKSTTNAHRFETNNFGTGSELLSRALELAQTILSK